MEEKIQNNNAKNGLYVIIGLLLITSIGYRAIVENNLEQTSLLFIGLPAFIAFVLIKYTDTPKSAYFLVFKVITIFLLLSSILLGEGIVCVLFTAPIFYGVGAMLVFIYQYLKARNKSNLNSIVALPLLLIIAQPMDYVGERKVYSISNSEIVAKSRSLENLNKTPDWEANFPSVLKIGFPKPVEITGSGIEVGDERNIQFLSSTKGIGTLSLKIVEKSNSKITFKVKSDDTHINHWISWDKVEVEIVKTPDGITKIIWTSNFKNDLGPNWYFATLEKLIIGEMNKYLIASYFK